MSTEKPKTGDVKRSPIVVIMGHIDHGKSTLLDYIRKANVVEGEAGGITQHMGAYEAEHLSPEGSKNLITFIDTPGHEAFCSIRERGTQAADVAILVVSAEDGVKPQTVEALKNILEQKIPYIVAITKIDKTNANIEKTKQSLGENEIYVEGWGGDIPCVPISAISGQGITELLDMVILLSEITELKTNKSLPASGLVIEANRDSKKGISATLLIKDGLLNIGDYVSTGNAYAPIRFIENFKGEKILSAQASIPVSILGWNEVPICGSVFSVVKNKKEAEEKYNEYLDKRRAEINANQKQAEISVAKHPAQVSSDNAEQNGPIILPIIIKADAIGSLDGIRHELEKIHNEKVKIKIVSEGIGDINENDIKIAQGDKDIIVIGFNSKPDKKTGAIIERSSQPLIVKSFNIIYNLTEFVQETLLSRVPKVYIEEVTGRAKILALFSKEKDRQVIGGKVEMGTIESGNDVRIMRRESEIGRGKIRELQEKKVKTREVAEGHEFGLLVEAKIEIAVGDRIECVKTVEKTN